MVFTENALSLNNGVFFLQAGRGCVLLSASLVVSFAGDDGLWFVDRKRASSMVGAKGTGPSVGELSRVSPMVHLLLSRMVFRLRQWTE